MNVEVKGCGDVGMRRIDADGLVVAVAFDAACGEAVAQPVEFQRRYAEPFHQLHVVVAVCTRLNGLRLVAYDVVVAVDHLLQWAYHRHQGLIEWYFAGRVGGLWSVDHNLSVFGAVIFKDVYSLHRALHRQHGAFYVEVAPFQSAYLADAKPGSKADVYAEVAECEVLTDVVQNLAMVCCRQDIYALLFGSGRIFDVPLEMLEIAVFFSEADYHLQDYEYVLDILLAQTGIKAVDYKRLHIRFGHGIKIAERREDLVFYDERVG